jgi:hypothetical protein
MARAPLNLLLSLRQREADRRRQDLAACVAAESQVAEVVRSLDAAMARDREHQDASEDHLPFRDIFLAARQHLREKRRRAAVALADAEAKSQEARRQLADARLAAEAVERLIAERVLLARAKADRLAQHELDDITRVRLK